MRLGVDSVENLRTGIIQTLHASKLPKVSKVQTIIAFRKNVAVCLYVFFAC